MALRPSRLSPVFVSLILSCMPAVTRATSVIPADKNFVRSLDGTWRFKLEQRADYAEHGDKGAKPQPIVLPKHFEPFEKLDYREDETWKDLKVPGNWEMFGFSPATYNNPDNAIGLYRLSFDVPADWQGRVVKINFDGVQNGAEVYCNGQPVNVDEPSEDRSNFHQGGFTAFQADLTPAVKFGQNNRLAVRVYKNTKSVDLDTGDFFFLGGIHRTVTLFSVPKAHLADVAVRTTLAPGGKAELRVLLTLTSPARGAKLSMQLEDNPAVDGGVDEQGHAELVQMLDHPRLWSAEHPNLYNLTVELKDDAGKVIEHVTQRVGVREVSIKDGIFLINNVPVKLAGLCRHDVYPTLGSALNEEVWRKDIELMKAANVNAIRTSHYPYGSKFYDLCDELGMYVMDEMAAGWVPTDDEALRPGFAQHARECVRRDKNHPSVIVWAIGNENPRGEMNNVAAAEIGKLDPTRPRLVSWRWADQGNVEIDDAHYTNPADIALAEREDRRAKFPKSYLENPNMWEARNGADYGNLDAWAPIIDRTWKEIWDADHVIGSFLWEWQDRAVCDEFPTKLYDYFPATGINLIKVKGLCDGFRTPRAAYYHVKVTYAPLKVDLTPAVNGSSATVHATNYYSFTDLSELKTTWRLMRDGKDIASSDAKISLAPRTRGDLKLDLPGDALQQADVLRLNFDWPDGRNIVTYDLRLRPERDSTPALDTTDLASIKFPRLNFVTVTYGSNPKTGWRWAYRHAARPINIAVQQAAGPMWQTPVGDENALCGMRLSDVRAMDADLVLPDVPEAGVVGHVRADCVEGHFSYRVSWFRGTNEAATIVNSASGAGKRNANEAAAATPGRRPPATRPGRPPADEATADVQEMGWVFALPKDADHFSWHRKGYWSYYPDNHIGRITGTATPDSAEQDVTKLTRPDAFDFNSTKYDCDWATLADSGGNGIGVTFAPDARGHVRAGTADDGRRVLVVNKYCAPPRDISSGVVPDLYFTLERGQATGGSFMVGTVRGGK